MLKIVEYPNKILRQKTQKVLNILDPKFQKQLVEMGEAMTKNDGLGLAAPQVGINQRVLVINLDGGPKFFINPRIIWKSFFRKNIAEEGCLSFPGIFGKVRRNNWIFLTFFDSQGKLNKIKVQGLLATVIQHEVDHLNGVLFIDKIFEYTKGEEKIKELIKSAEFNEK